MITWIQKYFQHHFRTIFVVLLGLLIISFVFTIGTPSGLNSADRQVIQRQFFDYNLTSQEGQRRLMGDASLSANLQMGGMGGLEAEQIQEYALQRAATLHLADQVGLPAPSDAEIKDFIQKLRAFMGQDGQFDATAYNNFRQSLKANPNITEGDIKRVLAQDLRAQKMQQLLGGPGYVLPADVKLQLTRTDTTWTIATATADYASFAPAIKPTDADLTKFFEDNAFRYEIPPRVIASHVAFSSLTYVPAITVTEDEVRAYYDANPARFPKPADPKAPTMLADVKTDSSANFAAVRPQVETALKLERAQRLAVKAASDFVFSLDTAKITDGPALEAALASQKLTLKPLAPFTREAGPAELGGSPDIAEAAFKLNKERFYSDALVSPMGAVVLFWKETEPARKPLFADVRAKVSTDYIENEKRKRFVELGRSIRSQLEARLKAGDAFEKAVATVSTGAGLKIETKTIPAFTARNRPQDLDYSVLGALERLERGQISDMAVTADKGIFVYAIDKKLPDLTEANAQYTATRSQLAAYTSRLGSGAVLSEVVERELKKSEPKPQ